LPQHGAASTDHFALASCSRYSNKLSQLKMTTVPDNAYHSTAADMATVAHHLALSQLAGRLPIGQPPASQRCTRQQQQQQEDNLTAMSAANLDFAA
jgi:hypothetical protein